MTNPVSVPLEISVTTPVYTQLSMDVYDLSGRHEAEIASGSFPAGEHSFFVDGLNTGVYFIGLNDGHSCISQRAVVVN